VIEPAAAQLVYRFHHGSTIVHGEHTYLRVAAAAEHAGPE
jgi:hypothetical protein